jgi:hypothetical protein
MIFTIAVGHLGRYQKGRQAPNTFFFVILPKWIEV